MHRCKPLRLSDCSDLDKKACPTGVYTIYLRGQSSINVLCNMDTDGGGWTVIQHRNNGSVNFSRYWNEYKQGFGSLEGEFWLGNNYIHQITSQGSYSLRVDLKDFENNHKFAKYSNISVESERKGHKLYLSGYIGTAGGSLISFHNSRKFSTIDRDNDGSGETDCAKLYKEGFEYVIRHQINQEEPTWSEWTNWSCCNNKGQQNRTRIITRSGHQFKYNQREETRNCKIKDCGELCKHIHKSGVYTINPTGTHRFDVYCNMDTDSGGWTVDCGELCKHIHKSGVYTINPTGTHRFDVYCNMDTDSGGWTVLQHREDGSVDFHRNWESYKHGFGSLNGEFWLGNEYIHQLTTKGNYSLRFDLGDFKNNTRFALYSMFSVGPEIDNYLVEVSGYDGNAGDSFSYHNGVGFSTIDSDNDKSPDNCARSFEGGWWYNSCHRSNLNGLYLNGPNDLPSKGVTWFSWKGHSYSLKRTTMMIRKR